MNSIFNNIDETVKPTEDFFKYATGKWIDNNPQPDEYPSWNVFTQLRDNNIKRVKDIITNNLDDSIISQKMKEYYEIITDYDRRNKEDFGPVMKYIHTHVFHPNNKSDNITNIDYIRETSRNFEDLFFSVSLSQDDKNPDEYAIFIYQSGLGLGNKEYYTNKTPENEKIINAYLTYIRDMHKYIYGDGPYLSSIVDNIWNTEMKLAEVSYTEEELQDPIKNYNVISVDDLSKATSFDWHTYLCDKGYTNTSSVIVNNLEFLKVACNILMNGNINVLRDIYRFNTLCFASSSLSDNIYDINFKFSQVLTGAKTQVPKEKRALSSVENIFSEVISQIYVKKYFSENAKTDVIELVNNLKKSFSEIIKSQAWMSDITKEKALDKLYSMSLKIGYPEKWEDISDIPVNKNLSYFENVINISTYFINRTIKKHYNKPVDKSEWHITPQTINAYYSPTNNEICFPAGILQYPFYSLYEDKSDDVLNYGAIGVIIGHEMTHAFDNHGKLYDKNGLLNEWWSEEDTKKFNELVVNTREHFNKIEALPGLFCNGSLTLGENLADYGGVKIAYNAYKNVVKSEDNWPYKFFVAYANNWSGVTTEESIRTQIITNEHSINKVRVNGTLPMFNEWHKCFGTTNKDTLYVPEDERAKIW